MNGPRTNHCRKLYWLAIPLLLLAAGCGEEQQSLHEDDHHKPDHWPTGMVDMADKLEHRLTQLNSNAQLPDEHRNTTMEELADLASWAPEFAADTDMTESDWVPIYTISEKLRKQFQSGDTTLPQVEADLKQLGNLLRTQATELANSSQAGEE